MFDGVASLVGTKLTRFYQKFIDGRAKPIHGYFKKNVTVYLIFDCHSSTPNLRCFATFSKIGDYYFGTIIQ
jgi:hypothetical protein